MKKLGIVFGVFALLLTSPARAALTQQQLIDYVTDRWELTDLTDDVISQTLNTSYSGIPFKDYLSYFSVAPDILNPLANGDYKTASIKAAEFAANKTISHLLSEAGLDGLFAPARLGAWAIERGLIRFLDAVKDKTFADQCRLYFEARKDFIAEQTANHVNAANILFTDDGWIHIVNDLQTKAGYPRYFGGPADFYQEAELLYFQTRPAPITPPMRRPSVTPSAPPPPHKSPSSGNNRRTP